MWFRQFDLLSKNSVHIDSDYIGLYKDDALAVINNANGPKLDRIRKNTIAIFQSEGLGITIETNLVETDFLDVTFNLSTGKYYPYNWPNNAPLYIYAQSNHPPSIVKQLPKIRKNLFAYLFSIHIQYVYHIMTLNLLNYQKWLIKESQIYLVMKPHLIMQKYLRINFKT